MGRNNEENLENAAVADPFEIENKAKALRNIQKHQKDEEQTQDELIPQLPLSERIIRHKIEQACEEVLGLPITELRVKRIGSINQVYFINVGNKRLVAKIEKRFRNKEDGTLTSPWTKFAVDPNSKQELTFENPRQRENTHLEITQRLNAAGIQTTKYIGAVLASGFDKEDTHAISSLGFEAAAKKIQVEHKNIPMYIEFWENPGGKEAGKDEETLNEMYHSPEGQKKLTALADGILNLARKGVVIDVTKPDKFEFGIEIIPETAVYKLPYPKNFIITNDGDFVCFDFNVAFDLTNEGVWDNDVVEDSDVIMTSVVDGLTYPNTTLQTKLLHSIATKKRAELDILKQKATKDNSEEIIRKYAERMTYWSRAEYEVERIFAQVGLAVLIKRKILEINDPERIEEAEKKFSAYLQGQRPSNEGLYEDDEDDPLKTSSDF